MVSTPNCTSRVIIDQVAFAGGCIVPNRDAVGRVAICQVEPDDIFKRIAAQFNAGTVSFTGVVRFDQVASRGVELDATGVEAQIVAAHDAVVRALERDAIVARSRDHIVAQLVGVRVLDDDACFALADVIGLDAIAV